MPCPRRLSQMWIPEDLIDRMEASVQGIRTTLAKTEKEFGLMTRCIDVDRKLYVIAGPNEDILEMALETLRRR